MSNKPATETTQQDVLAALQDIGGVETPVATSTLRPASIVTAIGSPSIGTTGDVDYSNYFVPVTQEISVEGGSFKPGTKALSAIKFWLEMDITGGTNMKMVNGSEWTTDDLPHGTDPFVSFLHFLKVQPGANCRIALTATASTGTGTPGYDLKIAG